MDFEKNKIYITGAILISIAVLYYLYQYQTIQLIRQEINKMAKEKRRREEREAKNMMRNKMLQQRMSQQPVEPSISEDSGPVEMDSYIDLGDNANIDEQQESHMSSVQSKNSRLSENNVLLRDMMDGSHQK